MDIHVAAAGNLRRAAAEDNGTRRTEAEPAVAALQFLRKSSAAVREVLFAVRAAGG
jgi:hypothetical protein